VVYSNRALIYQKLEQQSKAIEDCIKGIQIEPTFVKFYIRLATIYSESDKKAALDYIEKGLAFEPENQILLNMKEELDVKSPFDSFDPSTMDSLLKNKNLQDMVQNFVKDKTPEELNDMVSKVFGNLGKMK
jgi:tetratricopeptide (TPR) repeat protein